MSYWWLIGLNGLQLLALVIIWIRYVRPSDRS